MIILGYLTDGTDWKVDDVDLGSLTHINYAFATVKDTSGEVHENWNRAIQVKDLKANFPHLKVCVSIGGWGASNFSEAAETQESRELFSKSSIEIMQKYSMDGIDIDWEYPTIPGGGISCHPDDKKNFTLLLKQVRQDLDELSKRTNQDYLLTIAAGASLSYLRAVEMEELNQILDYVNIMTYDMGGSFHVTGHHTNIYPSCLTEKYGETYYPGGAYFIEQFIKLGMNVEKLVAGIAFYGRGGSKVENKNNGLGSRIKGEHGLYFDYHDIVKKINEEGFNEYWDDLAKAPWAYNGDTFITYENEKSVAEKMKYVKEKGLLGVMFWEYQTDQTKTLLNVIHENK
ncbi:MULTISPECIES: glycoside hydrolase family 18 protein [Turicibacter]|jgi:glycoside hydrolase|uniref:glycoside hydrolase family 18 protein n=2 Tax=Turicibacteraceae TaxID=2810281 RepID=UPI0001FD88D3|nr:MULTISPECIES: glycoside hydrolase family 18 protein [Turicibacter]EGC90894.1 putative chitinase ChiB1 [Turicibacter sp. HGF1]MCU7198200.1 glycoside hydrolase family 18 protein [Turicibacter sanguinis]MDB8458247.1 glycoside hydrolase family 18 protein [Turicibacter sanguinis]MDB8555310.1 glycoside hydrolase family 18 protein [Turicibacter sanguinis]MDB8557179.1 glycoside hydrolase family 18 protein [Turicibacter sanguinis]